MNKINVGVIGCGEIAMAYHLPAIARLEGIRLVYACDLFPERAEEAKRRFGFLKTTVRETDVLDDESIDAVCIFTKVDSHVELVTKACQAGKHIFMQKPLSRNLREALEMIRAVEQANVHFTPSFMHRYIEECVLAQKIILDGTIGRVRHVRIRNNTRNPVSTAASYGGCIMDIGCHGIDLVRAITNSDVAEVIALERSALVRGNNSFRLDADLNGDEIKATLAYNMASGATVTHEIDWSQISRTKRFEAEIYGEDGVIYLFNPHMESKLLIGTRKSGKEKDWKTIEVPEIFFGERQHRFFFEDLLQNKRESLNIRDALETLKVVEAARRSMVSGTIEAVLSI